MRLALFAAAVFLLAPMSHADTLDYVFTGVNVELCGLDPSFCTPQMYEFTLPSNPVPIAYTSDSFELNPNDVQNDGFYVPDTITEDSFTLFPGGFSPATLSAIPGGLFTGPTSAPTLLTGSGPSDLYSGDSEDLFGTLTVTDLNAAPTPEPSSWVFLGTGLVGVATTLKQRLRQPR